MLFVVQTELEFEPRYPLMGGWKITFTLGYSVPLEEMVFRAPDGRRVVNATFGSPILDVVIEEMVVKVGVENRILECQGTDCYGMEWSGMTM